MSSIAENFDSEPEDRKDEVKQEIKEKIAWSYSLHELTDDNVSELNGLTGLEQIIMYEFDCNSQEEIFEMAEEISDLAMELDISESEESFPKITDLQEQELILKLAKGYYREILTDDNVSRWVGLSGFEQAILYEFGPVLVGKFEELKSKILGMERDLRGGSRLRKLSNLDGYEQEFGF